MKLERHRTARKINSTAPLLATTLVLVLGLVLVLELERVLERGATQQEQQQQGPARLVGLAGMWR